MPVCKHPVATLGLGGNHLPCAYAQRQRRQQLPFGLLRSPNRSGSAMDKQVCPLLSPWAVVTHDQDEKNVGSKEPTFANGIRLLTSGRLFCHQRSCRGTGQRSSDPWGLLRSPSCSPRSCRCASTPSRHSAWTVIPFLAAANRNNTISNFLLDSYGVPTATARQCPRKRGRCTRLGRLSPTIRMKKT